MANHLSEPFLESSMSEEELYQSNQEVKQQVVSFALMIFLTVVAFLAISSDIVPNSFAVPIILIFALIQLALQLLFFMHMKDKDHGWAAAFMVTGMFFAVPTVASLIMLIGFVKY